MHIDNELEKVYAGQAIYIPPNSVQYIENIGKSDLKFLCIVDPAWKKEDEEILWKPKSQSARDPANLLSGKQIILKKNYKDTFQI